MEKGNSRNSSSSKTNTCDGRSKQDGGIKYNRFPRYKETLPPHPETRHKPNPQKSREAFDKRPRTRSGAVCEKYRNEVVIEELKKGNNAKQGSRKVNLNHLLNFTLASSDGRDFSARQPFRSRGKVPKYNKELFLQANCQFVTRDDGNYSLHSTNADLLVEWSLIEEIRLPSYEVASCPICLYPPVAAKISRCGHIFCWACILHYLSLTDRSWQKCPICFEAIQSVDLKSVLSITKKLVTVGNKINMCLMKRDKGSMFPVPAYMHKDVISVCKVSDGEEVTRYQKLLLASKIEVQAIIKREHDELMAQLLEEGEEGTEICFIESALKLLSEREAHLESHNQSYEVEEMKARTIAQNGSSLINEAVSVPSFEFVEGQDDPCFGKSPPCSRSSSHFDETSWAADNIKTCGSENRISTSTDCSSLTKSGTLGRNGKGTFYFYQAEDGQHIYLHGLNVRMLIKEYGCLENSPPLIEAAVLAFEKISMSEDLRKRLRYLQHIPLTCEFQVAELNLGHFLSQATVQEFADEVSKRQKMRSRKANEERKRDKYIEMQEKKKFGRYPGATFNLNSCDQFPVCDKRHIDNNNSRWSASSIDIEKNDAYEVQYPGFGISGLSLEESNAGHSQSPPVASFAELLRDGQTFNQNLQIRPKTSPASTNQVPNVNADSDEDEIGAVPEYHLSFSNSIQAALDAVMTKETDNTGGSRKASKKKKAKNKLLFSTSMCRSK